MVYFNHSLSVCCQEARAAFSKPDSVRYGKEAEVDRMLAASVVANQPAAKGNPLPTGQLEESK